jgi:hypothetical protein
VPGEYDVRIDGLKALERFPRSLEVASEWRELRPDSPRQHVQRRERVTDEEHPARGKMQRRTSLAVTGNVYDDRRTGYVERCAVAEGGDLENWSRPKHALGERETYEAERGEADPEHLLVLRFGLAPRHLRVELVNADRYALFAA